MRSCSIHRRGKCGPRWSRHANWCRWRTRRAWLSKRNWGICPTPPNRASTATLAALTDPEEAALFVERTGVDCLAVSIGNVHLLTQRPRLYRSRPSQGNLCAGGCPAGHTWRHRLPARRGIPSHPLWRGQVQRWHHPEKDVSGGHPRHSCWRWTRRSTSTMSSGRTASRIICWRANDGCAPKYRNSCNSTGAAAMPAKSCWQKA